MNKKSQMDVVYNIVKFNQPIRTERLKILSMQEGISCGDRYLRWLRKDGFISDKKFDKDNTKTWYTTDQQYNRKKSKPITAPIVIERTGQFCMASIILFCLSTSLVFGSVGCDRSMTGKEMTKHFEGYRSQVYYGSSGASLIGYGFNLDEVSVKQLFSEGILSGKVALIKEEAEHAFSVLYLRAQKDTVQFIGQDNFQGLNQMQKNILIDMAYTMGYHKLSGFKKMRAAIVDGDYELAAYEIKNSKWYTQTSRRGKHHAKNFSK